MQAFPETVTAAVAGFSRRRRRRRRCSRQEDGETSPLTENVIEIDLRLHVDLDLHCHAAQQAI